MLGATSHRSRPAQNSERKCVPQSPRFKKQHWITQARVESRNRGKCTRQDGTSFAGHADMVAEASQNMTSTENEAELGKLWTLIPGRLSFAIHRDEEQTRAEIADRPDIYFFSSDLHEEYTPFNKDFGPVRLSSVYKFCHLMHEKMSDPRLCARRLCYYAEKDVALRTNAAFLLGSFLMLMHDYTAEQVKTCIYAAGARFFLPFRDAAEECPTFHLELADCFNGLQRAVYASWFNLGTFNLPMYLLFDYGACDLHVVCPKFVAFRGPDRHERRPCNFFEAFQFLGVSDVIRLNDATTYESSDFVEHGIRHHDLEFPDCTAPGPDVVRKFLAVVSKSRGVVAVHCKAGLGRTGTLIAIWIMANLGEQCTS